MGSIQSSITFVYNIIIPMVIIISIIDIIINFMNLQLDHMALHQGKKLFIKYEDLKKEDSAWEKLLMFVFKDCDKDSS